MFPLVFPCPFGVCDCIRLKDMHTFPFVSCNRPNPSTWCLYHAMIQSQTPQCTIVCACLFWSVDMFTLSRTKVSEENYKQTFLYWFGKNNCSFIGFDIKEDLTLGFFLLGCTCWWHKEKCEWECAIFLWNDLSDCLFICLHVPRESIDVELVCFLFCSSMAWKLFDLWNVQTNDSTVRVVK